MFYPVSLNFEYGCSAEVGRRPYQWSIETDKPGILAAWELRVAPFTVSVRYSYLERRNRRALILPRPHVTTVRTSNWYPRLAMPLWSGLLATLFFCKAKYVESFITPESSTLKFFQDQQPSFDTPKILAQAIDKDKVYLFLQRLPGRTLHQAWPSLNKQWRLRYVTAIADACKKMARWEVRGFGGVDNQNTPWYHLQHRGRDSLAE